MNSNEGKIKRTVVIGLIILLTILLILLGTVISINKSKGLITKAGQIQKSDIEEIEDKNERIRLTYEIGERTGSNIKILIKVIAEDGIKEIHTPDQDIIYIYGGREKAIDYVVEIGVEYKFIIISETNDEKEEIIQIEPKVEISTPIIGNTKTAVTSVDDNSQIDGTTLYIRFSAKLEGTKCTITPEIPYKITENGKYKFIVTGIYNEKTIQKEVEVDVWKYQLQGGYVKYDAGDWTKEEITELKNQKLYDINISKGYEMNATFKLQDDSGKNFTFGGFTYIEDEENEKEIQEGEVITSRNQSVSTKKSDGTEIYPNNDGWIIFNTINSNDGLRVISLIHAGNPENFYCVNKEKYDAYRAEYLLSGGLRKQTFNTISSGNSINPRKWDMYRDKELDKKGYIKDVHIMTYNESYNGNNYWNLRDTGSAYFLASTGRLATENKYYLYYVDGAYINETPVGNYSVRPVVELTDNVFVSSGSGTKDNPYILKKSEN